MAMDGTVSRRALVAAVPALGAAALLGSTPEALAARYGAAEGETLWYGFPRQDQKLVREVVGASHRSEARVRELLDLHPALVNAWWDWGFGDWESPLGAAAHTGQRGIADLLLERGARADLFAAAMLGQLETVKGFIAASPGVQRTPGPHLIPLLAHARAGGEQAAAVAAYLETLGDAGNTPALQPLSEEQRSAYLGTYSYGAADADRFVIKLDDRQRLVFQKDEEGSRQIHHLGAHEFYPAGVFSVRLRFDARDGPAAAVTIVDHEPVVTAKRV